ncbi:primosomal protein N' [Blautia liquoris]|uniref:Replication restart protein PriA n=1 Tax=Blautia liquoris TaxID=2779518 RepID=A0A7M2RLI2_9FIRM|nr:primosomal protein N' [Blautia liquoris]QOV20210.1 primosomal protein N' [Blautia liquoris]
MGSNYADIIVDITHEKLDRTFQYKIPENLEGHVSVGSQVFIPFGNGNRRILGYVIGISQTPKYPKEKMKEVESLNSEEDAALSRMIALAGWMKKTYGSTMIQSLKTVIPVRKKGSEKEERYVVINLSQNQASERLEYYEKKNQKARARVLAGLMEKQKMAYKDALKDFRVSAGVMRTLEEQGVLSIKSRTVYRNPVDSRMQGTPVLQMSKEQNAVFDQILEEWKHENRTCLIKGVTGSGKTLIYMKLMEEMLSKGKQVILLIPEIALTYQNIRRFYGYFHDQVTVQNSKMTRAERFDQMERARKGQVQIVIGPRSALFTPFPNLGLIIIDEEHETTYKGESTPRYHARETAIERARLEGAHVVLGSATPSLESYYRCEKGEYALFELNSRYQEACMPKVYSVDMREELKQGNRSILSRRLQSAIQKRLETGEQTMLFLNRRGYAGFVSCRSCGHVMKCPHCDVSLTIHANGKLVCHYCGYETTMVSHCPKCGSPYIGGFRAGTQQIEQVVAKRFPGARIARMDLDTTRGKEGYQKILKAFSEKEYDILIGTQMIVKGHDFPNVTLMGVLSADLSLYASNYRAAERTYQLLVQAEGRSGRGNLPGEAVIQTYHPEHYSIQAAINQDYEEFYQEEISYRRVMGYPPASNLLAVHGSCDREDTLKEAMDYIRRYLDRICDKDGFQIIGPAAENVSKINDMYRNVLYIRQESIEKLVAIREYLERYIEINKGFDPIYIQYDIN